jgi:L-aspartate oxidase
MPRRSTMNNCIDLYTDVLIVGTGISGMYAALNLDSSINTTMITKSKIKESNSYLAQGGITVAKDALDIPVHIEDTLKAGKYKNKLEAVQALSEESRENIEHLINLGVSFDTCGDSLSYTKEAAHSTNRILHVKDETGKAIIDSLYEKVKINPNITIYEDTYLIDIISHENKCFGAIAYNSDGQINIHSKYVILASGGIGGIFKNSTNQRHMTADSIGIALKNNIKLKNLEYIQFHPTAFHDDLSNSRRFLISESLRGEGGKLKNIHGERFIDELLPRDIVTDAIYEELLKTNSDHVYLDLSFLDSMYLKDRFPFIYSECLKRGIDITKDYIPVSPAQHYFMGGIDVDLNSKSSMENLYVVGESSCTGVHGANRLASNSLIEGLVFSRRAAKNISKDISKVDFLSITFKEITTTYPEIISLNSNLAIKTFKREGGKIANELVSN